MKDLIEEIKELEAAIEHSEQVADSYKDTTPDCDCALEHLQLAVWLTELLEIKKARLSVEVFFHQEYDLCPDPEPEELEPNQCFRCKESTLVERGQKLICGKCGAVQDRE